MVIGLPEEAPSIDQNLEEEASFYFYEDDEDELANLIEICLPILNFLEYQIKDFNQFNELDKFAQENPYTPLSIDATDEFLTNEELLSKAWITGKPKEPPFEMKLETEKCIGKLLGIKRLEDWIQNLNIGNVMHLSPLTL